MVETGFLIICRRHNKQNYLRRMYLFCQNSLRTEKEIIFECTELGHLQKALPLKELSELLPLKYKRSGAHSWFDRQGMISLLFLQSYTQLSDRKFIDHLNGNWQMQMFCGIQLSIHQPIQDRNLMSRVRKYVSKFLDLEKFQRTLIDHWKPFMQDTHVGMSDATVYESHMRYPTDVKLLWECCEYLHGRQRKLSDFLGIAFSAKLYDRKKQVYLSYARRRKKPYRLTRKMRKQLVVLTKKLLSKLQDRITSNIKMIPSKELDPVFEKLRTIKQIITQQEYLLSHKGSKIADRILSLYKPYVRAIVRGKENKPVEFGAKVHVIQVDGINYVENFSYNAFNEGIRLKLSVIKHKDLFGKCSHWSADAIYANNKNRKYLSARGIITNFVPKGVGKEQEKQIKYLLNKERSTRLEGSFGVEKNYYGMRKINARSAPTERLCIHFGIMTANAVRISQRIRELALRQAA